MKAALARADTRNLILDATDRLLARYGYKKMSMEDLAREVGIGKGTIYLYFSSKEEVALARIDRVIDRLQDKLGTIARSDAPPAERLRRMLIERVMYRFDSVQHYTESLNAVMAAIRPSLLERRKSHFADEAQIFAGVLKSGRSLGAFTFKDPRATAEAMLLATTSLLPYSLSVKELGERDEVESKVTRIANLLLNGIVRS